MNRPPRVALFTDCFYEVNGAANSCRYLVQYAAQHNLPFLSVHSGPQTGLSQQGSVLTLELQRGRATFPVDADLGADPLLWRYTNRVAKVLQEFRPDIIHVISPGDFSGLGAYLGHRMSIPMVGSYHTQLHEYAGSRMRRLLGFLPAFVREPIGNLTQEASFLAVTGFYQIPRLLLTPTAEISEWLTKATGTPCRVMGRGVDSEKFSPAWRTVDDDVFRMGYVGRLTAEKNVRFFANIEQALIARGKTNFRFVIVGEGGERGWLADHLQRAELTGVLRGEALSRAYANFDLFVFPSHTDAFGNVVQEAMASGVPVVVTTQGGPRFVIDNGRTGFAAATDEEFIARVIELTEDSQLRRRMAVAARAATANRTWEAVLSNVYGYYREVCELAAAEMKNRAEHSNRFPPPPPKPLGYAASAAKQER